MIRRRTHPDARIPLSWHARMRVIPVLTFVLACVAPSAHAQNLHYGMNSDTLTPRMADRLAVWGAGLRRLVLGGDVMEGRGKGSFAGPAPAAGRAEPRRTHRTLVAALAYAPKWANGGNPYWYPPLNYQDWYDFVF